MNNRLKLHTLIISDIFGRTESLEQLCATINDTATIIDPYGGSKLKFCNEDHAYRHFKENVGLDRYTQMLELSLQAIDEEVILIGFSVGCSAIWKISNRYQNAKVKQAICYYGTQIRHHTDIEPTFPIELVFPAMEPHFSIEHLISQLASTNNVRIRQVPYLHGFMNHLSKNFDAEGYSQEVAALAERCC